MAYKGGCVTSIGRSRECVETRAVPFVKTCRCAEYGGGSGACLNDDVSIDFKCGRSIICPYIVGKIRAGAPSTCTGIVNSGVRGSASARTCGKYRAVWAQNRRSHFKIVICILARVAHLINSASRTRPRI